ncbi:MAG: glycosyltransferase family 2 protein [Rugosibacter sp.]|nr:glycosyltransferase family 2 protein [Rugosibacter sp.]
MTTTAPTPLSCYILTYNSERRLAQVLVSIQQIADEILIVDSGSTDQTLTIACSFGATILTRSFDNFRDQRIFAEDHCTCPWVLALDSDEVVSEALGKRLQQFKNTHFQNDAGTTPDGFSIRRNWFFMGQPVRNFYPVKTPEFIVRLFQRERLSHRGSRIIHEQLQLDGAKIGQINEPLLHYSCDSIDDLYAKIGLYTKLAAEDMQAKGEPSSWLKITIYPWLIWARWHLLYGGWRDGAPGWILGKYVRDTVYLKYLKLKYLNTDKPETA